MPLIEQALLRFRSLLDKVLALSTAFRFDSGNRQHLLAIALHGSVLEQARGIITLLGQHNITPAFIVLRSLLEAVVDLFNLMADHNYAEFMRCAWLNEQRRILASATPVPNANPYLAELANHATAAHDHLMCVRAELGQLKERGITPLKANERFERAQRFDLYQGPYAHLCLHSHNNIAALQERHFCETPSGLQVVYFRPPSDGDVQLLLDTTAGLVANSIAILCQLLECRPLELENITRRLTELRTLWNQCA